MAFVRQDQKKAIVKILKGLLWFVIVPALLAFAYGMYVTWELFIHTFAHGERALWAGPSLGGALLCLGAISISMVIGWRSMKPTAQKPPPKD